MRTAHHIHPEDLMKIDVFTETLPVLGLIGILGLLFVLLHFLS